MIYDIPVIVERRASIVIKADSLDEAIKSINSKSAVSKLSVTNLSIKVNHSMVETYNPTENYTFTNEH